MPGTIADLRQLDLAIVEDAVGPGAYERGREYARRGRVMSLDWDRGGDLAGSVLGRGELYRAVAHIGTGRDGVRAFRRGECTCPVGLNCKHVAAVVITAVDGRDEESRLGQRRPAAPPEAAPAWEEALRDMVAAPAARSVGGPLAIELSLQASGPAGRGAMRLMARPMRPGARGGWINGALTWSALDSWHGARDDHRPDHVALLREIAAAQRSRKGRDRYLYFSSPAERTLDLSACGAQLWPLLDEAARIGLVVIQTGDRTESLRPYRSGGVTIDITRADDAGLRVEAVVRADGDAPDGLDPVLFLGEDGHGVVLADTAAGPGPARWPLLLVRLAAPAPPALQRMVVERRHLVIPRAEVARFATEISPGLRRVAAVVSSDGSFVPPTVSAPALVLRGRVGDGHRIDLGWEWAYRVGEDERRVPLPANGDGAAFRDPDAERAALAGAVWAGTGLDAHGLVDADGRPAAGSGASLVGIESMRFATEVLPGLRELPDLRVELEGEPADYRDVADTLEIGVSTAALDGERDWFGLGVTIRVDGRELPFARVFAALAGGESVLLLDDGAHFSLREPRLQTLRELIEEARALGDPTSDRLRISRYQAGLWDDLTALGVITEQAEAWRAHVDALLHIDRIEEHPPPASMAGALRRYQREGFSWLAALWDLGLGGILADDMGLGKTLQALALVCHARERDPEVGPFLVVAPTSVVPGWVDEAGRFAPGLRVEAVTDTFATSGRSVEGLAVPDVVVTTYTLVRLDIEAYRCVAWAGVILDEAQHVKNHRSKVHRCVRDLGAPFTLALTGTPMENRLIELWALLSLTAPGLFPDPRRFAEEYARPIEREGDRERLARLRRRIAPLVMRRTKEVVARDLPAKQTHTLLVELDPRHRRLYDTYLQRERQRVLGLLGDVDRNRFAILRSITLLRRLSLHPGLVDERHAEVACAKLAVLREHIDQIAGGGHRALVFSQFTSFLAIVRAHLDRDGVDHCYLDGRTRRRDRVLERFRAGDDPVFLISLKAGGVGLNLTEADYCFLLDPWWNPATENQAIDRVHRIGQTRPVMVYRVIARDTIEERVVALAQRKAELFAGVFDDGDLFSRSLTAEDIRGLVE